MKKPRTQKWSLTALLMGIAIMGPLVAYAGISVIWPSSPHTLGVNPTPPLTFVKGTDYAQGETEGWLGGWQGHNANASFEITVNGQSGGQLTIDDYVNVTLGTATTFDLEIATALSGNITANLTTLKIRAWTGGTPPTADGDPQVCAVIDLTAAAPATDGACTLSSKIQIIMALVDDSIGSAGSVSIRAANVSS